MHNEQISTLNIIELRNLLFNLDRRIVTIEDLLNLLRSIEDQETFYAYQYMIHIINIAADNSTL